MTACLTSLPRYSSASALSFCSTNADTSWGVYSSSSICLLQSVPISLLTDITVRSELVTACRLAVMPTSLSPSLEKATTLGVVLEPSEFGMTTGCPPSNVATQLFVVPRSIPITGSLIFISPKFAWLRQIEYNIQNTVVQLPTKDILNCLWKNESLEWTRLCPPEEL